SVITFKRSTGPGPEKLWPRYGLIETVRAGREPRCPRPLTSAAACAITALLADNVVIARFHGARHGAEHGGRRRHRGGRRGPGRGRERVRAGAAAGRRGDPHHAAGRREPAAGRRGPAGARAAPDRRR